MGLYLMENQLQKLLNLIDVGRIEFLFVNEEVDDD